MGCVDNWESQHFFFKIVTADGRKARDSNSVLSHNRSVSSGMELSRSPCS